MYKINYGKYLKSDDWKNKRLAKLQQVNYCEVCNSINSLHVHHLLYKNLYDVELSDLMVLCKTCHFIGHDIIDLSYHRSYSSSERFKIIKKEIEDIRGLNGKPPISIVPRPKKKIYVENKENKKSPPRISTKSISVAKHFTNPKKAVGAFLYGKRGPYLNHREKSRRYSGPCKIIYSRDPDV